MIKLTLLTLSILGTAACAHAPAPFEFGISPITPAATGNVSTSVGPNGNTRVDVDVHHLSPPERVTPGATVYVVWATQLDSKNAPQNLGALRVDRDLNGDLHTKTPMQSFDLMITPELGPTVDAPAGKAVLDVQITPRS